MNGVTDNSHFIDNHCKGKAFGPNPGHHIFGFNKVCPSEVVFFGYLLNNLRIMVRSREKNDIWEKFLPR